MARMARNHRAYNTSDSPVVVSADGAQLDGRSFGKVDPDDEFAAIAIAAKVVLLTDDLRHPEPPDPPAPDAAALDAAQQQVDAATAGEPAAAEPKPTASPRRPRPGR